MIVSPGSTSISIIGMYVDDSGLPLTGKVAADMPTIYYATPRTAKVAIPLYNLSAITDAYYSTGGNYGFKEHGGGRYRLDLPNAAFAAETQELLVWGEDFGKHFIHEAIQVVDAKVGSLTTGALTQLAGTSFTFSAPSLVQGEIKPSIIRHRDYSATDEAAIEISVVSDVDYTGASVYLTARTDANSNEAFRWTGSIINPSSGTKILRFEPTAAQTASPAATYEAQAVVVLASGRKLAPARIFKLPLVGKDDAP